MRKLLTVVACALTLLSCSKNESFNKSEISIPQKMAKEKASYDEIGCVTGTCMGTQCVKSSGNTCKKPYDCTAVPGGCLDDKTKIKTNIVSFSTEYADFMVENGYKDMEGWQESYDLCYSLLLERINTLPE